MTDDRYRNQPWNLIKNENYVGRPVMVIFLALSQGMDSIKALGGHYNSLIPIEVHEPGDVGNSFANTNENNDPQETASITLNMMLWNCRSMRNLAKRAFLTDVLLRHEIDIAQIVETFFISEDNLYVQGWKIFRVDNSI